MIKKMAIKEVLPDLEETAEEVAPEDLVKVNQTGLYLGERRNPSITAPFPGFQKLDEHQRDARALAMDSNRGRDPLYRSIPVVAYDLDKSKDGDFTHV
jgi:hypothetical protein